MFYQNWKLALISIIMIPLASAAARTLGKRIGKAVTEQMNKSAILTSYLIEFFKNHKLMKVFQRENDEKIRANKMINELRDKAQKISIVLVRASPIMEFLTGIMIALLIFISAKLVSNNELEVSNFFSFLAAMMLAYQPVRSLATLNITIHQGLAGAKRVLPILDDKPKIKDENNAKELKLTLGKISFENIYFNYSKNEAEILKNVNLDFQGQKMTTLVGQSGAGKSTILNLIPRFYDAISGNIKIDGQSVYETTLLSLRNNIFISKSRYNII